MEVRATSGPTPFVNVGNKIAVVQLSTSPSIWRVFASGVDLDEARNRLFSQLFVGLGDDASDPNGFTGLTELRISEAALRGYELIYAQCSSGVTIGDFSGANVTITASSGEMIGTAWRSSVSISGSQLGVARLQRDPGAGFVNIHSRGASGSDDFTFSASHWHSNAAHVGMQVSATGEESGGSSSQGSANGVLVSENTVAIVKNPGASGTAIASLAFAISATAPDTATFPLGDGVVIFEDTVSPTVTNTITTFNTVIDGSNSFAAEISYNGGTNFETITDAIVQRNINTGSVIQHRYTFSRTDQSVTDSLNEFATTFNWY